MKRLLLIATWALLNLGGSLALAEEPGDEKTEGKKTGIFKSHGTIRIQTDDTVHQFTIDDLKNHEKVLESVPKGVRVHVKKALKDLAKHQLSNPLLVVRPDENVEAFHFNVQKGKDVHIEGLPDQIAKHVEFAIKKAQQKLEHPEKSLNEALENMDDTIAKLGKVVVVDADGEIKEVKVIKDGEDNWLAELFIRRANLKNEKEQKAKEGKSASRKRAKTSDLEKKLDLILNRLEQIEEDVHELKEAR